MAIDCWNDFLNYLGVKESELKEYFVARDNILSEGRIILTQRTQVIPSFIRTKLASLGATSESIGGRGVVLWTVTVTKPEAISFTKLLDIRLERLRSFPFQARVSFDHFGLEVLAATIKTYGVIEPLLVRPVEDGIFEVVAGERRFRACQMAKLLRVPCVVKSLNDEQALECAMVENVQRMDLSDYEVARMLAEMTKRFGYTQEQLAEKVGKSREWVALHLRMLDLEKQKIVTRVTMEKLTEGHAREILAAPPEERKRVANEVSDYLAKEGTPPSVREIRRMWRPPEPEAPSRPEDESEEGEEAEDVLNLESKIRSDHRVPDAESAPGVPSDFDAPTRKSAPHQEPEPVDVGEFICPVCKSNYRLVHHGPDDDRLERITEEEN